jgi:hypothetical protein
MPECGWTCVGGTERLAGVLDGPRLDDVDDLAAA